jgi:hypothetical protein
MSNHYHLAVRCTSAPLWRSLASIQVKVAQAYNARHRVYGPFWQGRYKAKLVEDPGYLRQLVLYVHLNPVASGIVEKPEEFSSSGHREVVRKVREPLVDPDQLLLIFDETRRAARRAYLTSIRANRDAAWAAAAPGGLPWWRLGRPEKRDDDEELAMDSAVSFIDELGRSTAPERPRMEVDDFIGRALGVLAVDAEDVAGRTKRLQVVRARELILTLGVERYGLRVKDLAAALGVRYDTASLWGRRGARRRCDDGGFAQQMNELDTVLTETASSRTATDSEH